MRNPTVAGLAERLVRPLAERSYQPFELVSEVDKPRLEGLEDAFPTSRLSLGLLFHSRQRPDSSVYHDVFHYRFDLAWDEARSATRWTGWSPPIPRCVRRSTSAVHPNRCNWCIPRRAANR